jgi:hypothetical protein
MSQRRVLPLICLLFLPHGLAAQPSSTANIPATGPVTKPYQTTLFVPPPPYEGTAPQNYFWFGTARLWTLLPVTGTWPGLRGYTPNDSTFRQKLPF